jgi:hypothetical protein
MQRVVVFFAAVAHSSSPFEVSASSLSSRNLTKQPAAVALGSHLASPADTLVDVFEKAGLLLERGMQEVMVGARGEDQERVLKDFRSLRLLAKKMQSRYNSEISSLRAKVGMQTSTQESPDCAAELMRQRAALDSCTQELLTPAPASGAGLTNTGVSCTAEVQAATQASETKCATERQQDKVLFREQCRQGTDQLNVGLKKAWGLAEQFQKKLAAVSAEKQVLAESVQNLQRKVDTLEKQKRDLEQDDGDRLSNLWTVNDNLLRDVDARKQMIASLGQQLDIAREDKVQLIDSMRSLVHENAALKNELRLPSPGPRNQSLSNRSGLPGQSQGKPKLSRRDISGSNRVAAASAKLASTPASTGAGRVEEGDWSAKMDKIDRYLGHLTPDVRAEVKKATARTAAAPQPVPRGPFSWPDPAAEAASAKHGGKSGFSVGTAVGRGAAKMPKAVLPSSRKAAASASTAAPMVNDGEGTASQQPRGNRLAPATATVPGKAVDAVVPITGQVVAGAGGPDAIAEGSTAALTAARDLKEAEALIPAAVPDPIEDGAAKTLGTSQAQRAGGANAENGAGDGSSDQIVASRASRALGEAEALMASALAL